MNTIPECVAGSIVAGFSSTLVGHPLDTIKVHLQTQNALKNATTVEAARHILRLNGYNISVFFRGIMPPLSNQIIMNTVMFSLFHEMKSWKILGNESLSSFGSGLVSGFATALISTPTDLVKIKAQLSHNGKTDSATIVKSILNQNQYRLSKSIGAFYKGNVSNLAREGVFTMVYLGLYDYLKAPLEDHFELSSSSKSLSLALIIGVSSFTGALAWIASYPFDTIKTVIQSSNKNTTQAVKYIYESGGWKSFYRGCFASTGRAMLVTSIRMVAFEWTTRFLSNYSR